MNAKAMGYTVSLAPLSKTAVKLKLYRNVKNVSELRQKIVNGDLKCCMVKPNLILDPFQVIVAANKAVVAAKLKTKSVYSEILFNLSVTKNISQSLQQFGIQDGESDVLAIALGESGNEVAFDRVFQEIKGEEVDVELLSRICDRNAVKKVYKISDVEFKEMNLLDSVVSRIGAKDCL